MLWFGRKKKKAAEAAKRAEAEKQAAEAAKRAEAEKQAAEAAKRAEAEKQAAEAAKKVAPAKKAQTEKKAESAKKAEPAKKAKTEKQPAKEEEAEEISEETARSRGKFEIKTTVDGRFMFNLRAGNTQIIASSQIYSSMAACRNGIASIGANAAIANTEDQTLATVNVEKCPKFQIYLDKAGKYRFNLIATNGQNILSSSQGYMQKSSCKNGINSVIQNSGAPVVLAEEQK